VLSDQIYIYAEKGPDLDRFLAMGKSFNRREKDPTRWEMHVYTGSDYLNRCIEEKSGDTVVLAGKSHTRMADIDALNRSGFSVLGDKPWVISESGLPGLESAMAADRPLSLDIMTERYEITTLLQKMFIAQPDVFGDIRIDPDGTPSVIKKSVHHLYKTVNNAPLIRPPWFFDIRVQGEGIVDVTTHLVDMTHWMLFPGQKIHYEKDIALSDARRWTTSVPLDTFKKITQTDRFPAAVADHIEGDILNYFCNGGFLYRVRNVPVYIQVLWNLEIPEGGGDTHYSYMKGTRSDLLLRQGPESGFLVELLIIPKNDFESVEKAVRRCFEKWSGTYPGLSVTRENNKLLIHIPDRFRTTHEEHFCQVRNAFLQYMDTGSLPPEERTNLISKYTLLAEARKQALASPFEPLQLSAG